MKCVVLTLFSFILIAASELNENIHDLHSHGSANRYIGYQQSKVGPQYSLISLQQVLRAGAGRHDTIGSNKNRFLGGLGNYEEYGVNLGQGYNRGYGGVLDYQVGEYRRNLNYDKSNLLLDVGQRAYNERNNLNNLGVYGPQYNQGYGGYGENRYGSYGLQQNRKYNRGYGGYGSYGLEQNQEYNRGYGGYGGYGLQQNQEYNRGYGGYGGYGLQRNREYNRGHEVHENRDNIRLQQDRQYDRLYGRQQNQDYGKAYGLQQNQLYYGV